MFATGSLPMMSAAKKYTYTVLDEVEGGDEPEPIQPVGLFSRVFGVPIFTQDFDGEIRKRRMFVLCNGNFRTTDCYGEDVECRPDGSIIGRCGIVERWFHRGAI